MDARDSAEYLDRRYTQLLPHIEQFEALLKAEGVDMMEYIMLQHLMLGISLKRFYTQSLGYNAEQYAEESKHLVDAYTALFPVDSFSLLEQVSGTHRLSGLSLFILDKLIRENEKKEAN